MQASICHIKLARILSGILKEQYSINPLPTSSQALVTIKYDVALQSWHADSSAFVTKTWQDILLMAPPFSRQCEVLIHAYSHAVILLHRPLLLCDIRSHDDRVAVQRSAEACIDAALTILDTFAKSCEGGRMFGAFWLMQYYVFCAIAILYVCIIRRFSASSCWREHLATADRCQNLLSRHASQASFARRYSIFLGELRSEAERKVERSNPGAAINSIGSSRMSVQGDEEARVVYSQQQHEILGPSFDMTDVDPATVSSLFDELTNWEELDSFVMAGIDLDFDAAFASATEPSHMI
ncbi:hypothetical protein E4T43_04555 [Aureobasidium subglaciale]|nr:hypothetical protein E4T43_04555 [Aureobasidium subglaciale]